LHIQIHVHDINPLLHVSAADSHPHSPSFPSALTKSNYTVTVGGWGRRIKGDPKNSNSQNTAVITIHNSLNMSLHCEEFYGQIEFILYIKFSYCYFVKTETFSRIETCFPVFSKASNKEYFTYMFNSICCT